MDLSEKTRTGPWPLSDEYEEDPGTARPRIGDVYCRGVDSKAWFFVQDVQWWPKVWLADRRGFVLLMNKEEFEALDRVTDESLLGLYYLSLIP